MIYLIERAWWDPLENRNDFGYEVVGYVNDEETAKRLVEEAGYLRGDETWSIKYVSLYQKTPHLRYKELKEYTP